MAEIKTVLPELPEPDSYCTHADCHEYDVYTADQMRAYAEAAVLPANAGKVDVVAPSRDSTDSMLKIRKLTEEFFKKGKVTDETREMSRIVLEIEMTATQSIIEMKSPTKQAIDAEKV